MYTLEDLHMYIHWDHAYIHKNRGLMHVYIDNIVLIDYFGEKVGQKSYIL